MSHSLLKKLEDMTHEAFIEIFRRLFNFEHICPLQHHPLPCRCPCFCPDYWDWARFNPRHRLASRWPDVNRRYHQRCMDLYRYPDWHHPSRHSARQIQPWRPLDCRSQCPKSNRPLRHGQFSASNHPFRPPPCCRPSRMASYWPQSPRQYWGKWFAYCVGRKWTKSCLPDCFH